MIRGSAVWIDLSDAHPPEVGKKRPAIVLSNTDQNLILETVVVVPVSSQPPEIPPLRLRLNPIPGLKGYAILPGIRQVKKSRILGAIGSLSDADLKRLEESVLLYLGD